MSEPILFHNVTRLDRSRREYKDIPDLAESLYEKGFIHPICINSTNELIAGGRRSAALDYLLSNRETYPPQLAHSSMQEFLASGLLQFGVHYTLRPTETIDELSELELVENVQRHSFSWQEELLAIRKIHTLKLKAMVLGQLKDCEKWGQRETGRLLKISLGSVSYAVTIGKELDNPDSPLWKLDSLTEALQFLAKKKLDEASLKLAERVKERAMTVPVIDQTFPAIDSVAPQLPSGFLSTYNPDDFQSGADIGVDVSAEFGPAPGEPAPPTRSIVEPVRSINDEALDLASKLVTNMKWEEFQPKMGNGFTDHIICDPPYAIDMEMLAQAGGGGQKDIDRIAHTHDAAQNKSDFEVWLKCCYDALKEKGFCIWFCDAAHFQYLVELGFKIGFKVQRWPFHWIKTTSCSNQRAEYNFTKSVEHAIIFRKGDARLVSQQSTNYWMGGLTPDDKAALPNHPFIKPLALWQHLMKAVALPGSTLTDPFSGVGSSTRAAMMGGWQPLGVEMDPVHYSQQIHNLSEAYKQMRNAK